MDIEILNRANELIKYISGLQKEIAIWDSALRFEDNIRVSDGDCLKRVDLSSEDFGFIKDYVLRKLRERLYKAEEEFESL